MSTRADSVFESYDAQDNIVRVAVYRDIGVGKPAVVFDEGGFTDEAALRQFIADLSLAADRMAVLAQEASNA